jgi:hypothetical protein
LDGLTLLRRAQDAGLRLEIAGTAIKISGPKKVEPLVRLLAEHKAQVLEALRLANGELQKIQEMQKIGPASPQGDLDLGTYNHALAALRAECPAYVDAADWQQAIEDGHRFATQWGKQAEALGWAPADLFGLHIPHEKPAPNYRRLSRYDQTGLIWLLHGRPAIALTQTAATILAPSGASLMYHRHSKPAPAAGDCLDHPWRTEADGQPAGQGCSHLARPWCSEPEAGGRMSGRPR